MCQCCVSGVDRGDVPLSLEHIRYHPATTNMPGHSNLLSHQLCLCGVCRGGDVPLSVEHIRYYAGWADKIHGKIVPTGGKFYAQVYKEPLGNEPLGVSVVCISCMLHCSKIVATGSKIYA